MNFKSYIKKSISLLVLKTIYRGKFLFPNLYLFNINKNDLPKTKRILFYFASDEYMHLGDHLFFIPVLKTFLANGYDVTVMPTNAMAKLLTALSIPIVDKVNNLDEYDLIISRVELARHFICKPSLLVNVSQNLTLPICDQLLSTFSTIFNFTQPFIKPDYLCLKEDNILNRFALPTNKKLILFNLYCDAAFFMINQKKIAAVINVIHKYVNNPEYQLVFVGAKNDKLKDPRTYDFDFIDLRGKTTVIDMFSLVAHPNVSYYIGFDAFVMHVFSLYAKKSFVVFRGRFLKRRHEMIKNFHVNLFIHDNYVQLIDVE